MKKLIIFFCIPLICVLAQHPFLNPKTNPDGAAVLITGFDSGDMSGFNFAPEGALYTNAANVNWEDGYILCNDTHITLSPASSVDQVATISMWVMYTNKVDNQYAWIGQVDGNNQIRIFTTGGNIRIDAYDNSAYQFLFTAAIPDTNQFHHIAVTWATNDARFYLDGVLQASDTAVNMAPFSTHIPLLAYFSSGSLRGKMTAPCIWRRVSSQDEILNDYENGKVVYNIPDLYIPPDGQ